MLIGFSLHLSSLFFFSFFSFSFIPLLLHLLIPLFFPFNLPRRVQSCFAASRTFSTSDERELFNTIKLAIHKLKTLDGRQEDSRSLSHVKKSDRIIT